MKSDKTPFKALNIRITPELHSALKKEAISRSHATSEFVSITDLVVPLIEKAFGNSNTKSIK